MTIPMVPFEGHMSYCLIRSLQMVMAQKGQTYPVPWLECVSGEPFGFAYIRNGKSFFAVNGYAYHFAGEHLLRTLNYDYSYTGASNDTEALAALKEALSSGPVAVGMLDMGYLTYMPHHKTAHGADHAIVILALQDDRVIVHDPAGYPAVPLPLDDFLQAWQRDIYTGKPYGLWKIGQQEHSPDEDTIWERTLARARSNFAQPDKSYPDGTTHLFGPNAMRTLAADIRNMPDANLNIFIHFSWQVSGQRCLDSAFFLRERLPQAAAIRWKECLLYGTLQQATTADPKRVPDLLEHLADYEAQFIAALA